MHLTFQALLQQKQNERVYYDCFITLKLHIVNVKTDYFNKWLKIQYLKTVIKNPSIVNIE